MAIHPSPTDFAPPEAKIKPVHKILLVLLVFAAGWAVGEQERGSATPTRDVACAQAFEYAARGFDILADLIYALETGDTEGKEAADEQLLALNQNPAFPSAVAQCRGGAQ